jgi:anaerobic carbon-monoxide dehydrogenase iron sulfur subunit
MSQQPQEIFVDLERCMGCHSCELACAVAHSTGQSLYTAIGEHPRPMKRIYIEWVAPDQKVPLVCRHCEDAPCLHACISGAITRTAEGVNLTDEDKCIGCWTCVMMCPFGVIGRHLERHKAYRCDRCPDRAMPACVQACPAKALQYRTVERLSDDLRKRVAQDLVTAAESSAE